jgi:hypothetical protein
MTKATHNGTCQRCGAQQAIKKGVLVNHGYSVLDGWFEGICSGTGHPPLEQDTGYAEETVRFCREKAADLATFTADEVKTLAVRVRVGNFKYDTVQMTTEEYATYARGNLSALKLGIMIEHRVWQVHHQSRTLVEHAEMLAERIKTVFGQPLISRESLLPERVRFEFMLYSDAYTKAVELKAEGFKTRIAGDQRKGWALSGTK